MNVKQKIQDFKDALGQLLERINNDNDFAVNIFIVSGYTALGALLYEPAKQELIDAVAYRTQTNTEVKYHVPVTEFSEKMKKSMCSDAFNADSLAVYKAEYAKLVNKRNAANRSLDAYYNRVIDNCNYRDSVELRNRIMNSRWQSICNNKTKGR